LFLQAVCPIYVPVLSISPNQRCQNAAGIKAEENRSRHSNTTSSLDQPVISQTITFIAVRAVIALFPRDQIQSCEKCAENIVK